MKITATQQIDTKLLTQKMQIPANEMHRSGLEAREEMQKRIDRGLDVNLNKMKPYVKTTVKRKEKKGKQTDPVNLRDTGRMRNSIAVINPRINNIDISIQDHRQAAYYVNNERPFWGIDTNMLTRARMVIERYLRRIAK